MFTHKLGTVQADAWPVIAHDRAGLLDHIIIESHHPAGNGRVYLSPEQALYVQSRLGLVTIGCLHHDGQQVSGLLTDHGPDATDHQMRESGARVWAIVHPSEGGWPAVEELIVESLHRNGDGIVHLTAEQADVIATRLNHIAMEYLHDDVWGGEDARRQ
jgi:hypothetical protein